MKLKTRFIINPISGNGKQLELPSFLDRHLDKDRFDWEIVQTEGPKHAKELASEAVERNFDVVVAVGGDGSVNEVGRRLIHSQTALAIIPSGSGNGLARTLGIPIDWKKAILHLNNAEHKQIDTGKINSEKFIGLSGIGFDGLISHKFSHENTRGLKTYLKLIGEQMLGFEPFPYRIEADGMEQKGLASVIVAANSQQWGNDAKIAPFASLTDGLLALVVLPKVALWQIPELAIRIMNGTIHQSHLTHIVKCSEATIYTDYSMAHVDGEPISLEKEIKVACVKGSLWVMT